MFFFQTQRGRYSSSESESSQEEEEEAIPLQPFILHPTPVLHFFQSPRVRHASSESTQEEAIPLQSFILQPTPVLQSPSHPVVIIFFLSCINVTRNEYISEGFVVYLV